MTFTLTTPACPIGPQVSEQMREFVGDLEGIDKVHPKMVFDPPVPGDDERGREVRVGLLNGLAMRFAGSALAPLQRNLQP